MGAWGKWTTMAALLLGMCLAHGSTALGQSPDGGTAAQQPAVGLQAVLDRLNKALENVESESDFGDYLGYYQEGYLFLAKEGKLFAQEVYKGHNRDETTRLMEWSGTYFRMIDPLKVSVQRSPGKEYFIIACLGNAMCIPYTSSDERTVIRGQEQGKPRSLAGTQDKMYVYAGKDEAKLNQAFEDMNTVLETLRAGAPAQ